MKSVSVSRQRCNVGGLIRFGFQVAPIDVSYGANTKPEPERTRPHEAASANVSRFILTFGLWPPRKTLPQLELFDLFSKALEN